MSTQLIPEPIRILMVEDDPGDVRLTREALKNNKVHIILHDVPDGIGARNLIRER